MQGGFRRQGGWWSGRRGPRRLRPLPIILLLAAAVAFYAYDDTTGVSSVSAPGRGSSVPLVGILGPARVVDGDTLVVAGQTIRLDGIDAPEGQQRCQLQGRDWACGQQAARELASFLASRPVQCRFNGRDRYDRILAHCEVGGQDIGAWLVRQGWAVAYTRYSQRYVPEEAEARRLRTGLWAGRFQQPEDWRRSNPR